MPGGLVALMYRPLCGLSKFAKLKLTSQRGYVGGVEETGARVESSVEPEYSSGESLADDVMTAGLMEDTGRYRHSADPGAFFDTAISTLCATGKILHHYADPHDGHWTPPTRRPHPTPHLRCVQERGMLRACPELMQRHASLRDTRD